MKIPKDKLADIKKLVNEYIKEQPDDEKDEWWGTPKEVAAGILIGEPHGFLKWLKDKK